MSEPGKKERNHLMRRIGGKYELSSGGEPVAMKHSVSDEIPSCLVDSDNLNETQNPHAGGYDPRG